MKHLTLFILLFPCLILTIIPAESSEIYKAEQIIPDVLNPYCFREAKGLTSSGGGAIWVVDGFNNRIQKLSQGGRLVVRWGREGNGIGEFQSPYDIAYLPSKDLLWVSDSGNRRLQIFDGNGQFIEIWNHIDFQKPTGLAISPAGDIYVVDTLSSRVFRFSKDRSLLATWGKSGSGDGMFNWPHGIAVNPTNGIVYIADSGNHRIQAFHPDGTYIRTWGEKGDGEGQFDFPEGVGISPEGQVFVADRGNSRIQVFASDGTFVSAWATEKLRSPFGISIDNNDNKGRVWISDTEDHTVQCFTLSGDLLRKFGSHQLSTPDGIALGPDGRMWVADTWNHRIVSFEPDGTPYTSWGEKGGQEGALSYPSRIEMNPEGLLFVSDSNNNRIQIFSPQGQWIQTIGEYGQKTGQFSEPRGLCFDSGGTLFIADKGNCRIQVFTRNGDYLQSISAGIERPEDVAVSSDRMLYVADSALNQILKFDESGTLVQDGLWPKKGFQEPHGLTIDPEGNLLVTELSGHRVTKLNSQGDLLAVFGEQGSFPGQLMHPGDLVADSENRVFIADAHNHRIQVFSPGIKILDQKAILVAGGGPYAENDLWDATRLSAHQAYMALKHQGFARDRIRYYSHDVGLDLDNNGLADDIAGVPALPVLDRAVREWADDADWLILYLVDHGSEGRFRLGPFETISELELAAILRKRSGKTLVVIDACQSGSFLAPLANPNRAILASTGENQSAHFIGNGAISFSSRFWTGVLSGASVRDSYEISRQALESAGIDQTPALGWGSGLQENDLHIGLGAAFGTDPILQNPIVALYPSENRLSLRVSSEDPKEEVERVWAMLKPDGFSPASPDTPVLDLPTLDLAKESSGDYFAESAIPFVGPSITAAFYARNISGRVFGPLVQRLDGRTTVFPVALLIAGPGRDSNQITQMDRWIDTARSSLLAQGYSDEKIGIFHADDTGAIEGISSFLSSQDLDRVSELVVYYVGPIATANQASPITPLEIGWLIEGFPKCIVLWDAPRQEDDELSPLSQPGRIVLSGFKNGPFESELAFSELFWADITRGLSLWESFRRAEAFTPSADGPILDDDGDGVFNSERDGILSNGRYIGVGFRLADSPEENPAVVLSTEDSFTLTVTKPFGIGEIFGASAEIQGPSLLPGQPISMTREIELFPTPAGELTAEIDGLGTFGYYEITIYAVTGNGTEVPIQHYRYFKNRAADLYEPDDQKILATPITLNAGAPQEHSLFPEGDEDWMAFYASRGEMVTIKILPMAGEGAIHLWITDETGSPLSEYRLDLNPTGGPVRKVWIVPHDGLYFINIVADQVDTFPLGYGLMIDQEIQPIPAYLRGRVTNPSGNAVPFARISTSAGATGLSNGRDGSYLIIHPPGGATMTVSAEGYAQDNRQVTIGEGEVVDVNIQLYPEQPPNLLPSAEIRQMTSTEFMEGETIQLRASDSDGELPLRYRWYITGAVNGTLEGQTVEFSPETVGEIAVTLEVTDASGDVARDSIIIRILPEPAIPLPETPALSAEFIVPDSGVDYLANEMIHLGLAVRGGTPPYSFQWDFGDGIGTSLGSIAEVQFQTAGTHRVAVTVSDTESGSTLIDLHIDVVEALQVKIAVPSGPYEAGKSITLKAEVRGGRLPYSYEWEVIGADPSSGDSQELNIQFPTAGEVRIRLRVSDSRSTEAIDSKVLLVEPPILPHQEPSIVSVFPDPDAQLQPPVHLEVEYPENFGDSTRWQVAMDDEFTNLLFDVHSSMHSNSIQLRSIFFPASGYYYWRAGRIDGEDVGEWSTPRRIWVQLDPIFQDKHLWPRNGEACVDSAIGNSRLCLNAITEDALWEQLLSDADAVVPTGGIEKNIGLFYWRLQLPGGQSETELEFRLNRSVLGNAKWNLYSFSNGWSEVSSPFSLSDGGMLDADGLKNGTIVGIATLNIKEAHPLQVEEHASAGKAGGCFISVTGVSSLSGK